MNTIVAPGEADETGLVVKCPQCGRRNRANYSQLGRTFRCGFCHEELSVGTHPVEVRQEGVFDALVGRSTLPVVIDFWASWCGPCKMIAPEFVKVAAEGTGRWVVGKVSTEELPGIAQRFSITAIPTVALFLHGRELARQAGAMPASAILHFISRTLAGKQEGY